VSGQKRIIKVKKHPDLGCRKYNGLRSLRFLGILRILKSGFMKGSEQILPGIRRVYWVDADLLMNDAALRAGAGLEIPIFTTLHPVSMIGQGECTCTTSRKIDGVIQEASLKFLSVDRLPMTCHLAFVVEDIAGGVYLIGSKEPPYPEVKTELSCGDQDNAAGLSHTVTHKAIRSMMRCKISILS